MRNAHSLLVRSLSRVVIAGALASSACTTVRQAREPTTIPVTGKAEKTRTDNALDYSVAIPINAPPETVWSILVDAPSYTTWNSTITKLDGKIALGDKVHLLSKDAPDKTFDLTVSTLDANKHMVWEDGGSMFLGVRNFTLYPKDGATVFVMQETFSGGMLGMIEKSLPDFTHSFETFAADLKKTAEAKAPKASDATPPATTPPTPATTTTPPAANPAPTPAPTTPAPK